MGTAAEIAAFLRDTEETPDAEEFAERQLERTLLDMSTDHAYPSFH